MKIRSRFNERKATQVAARFLALAGKEMPYISLIKLMYFTDREALLRWGSPLTNDTYFSLNKGPILSAVMDLIVDGPSFGKKSFWAEYISGPQPTYTIKLIDEPGSDELSDAEEALIHEIHERFGHLPKWKLVRISHDLPEWENPHGSSIPIRVEDILKGGKKSGAEAEAIKEDLAHTRAVQSLFGAR